MIHLYPFAPRGSHGGTLRLRASIAASSRFADTSLHVFENGHWLRVELAALEEAMRRAVPPSPAPRSGSKRSLFPSTLWESNRSPLRSLTQLPARPGDCVVLHTTYLAPAAARLKASGARVVVDAYDLVWRAHANDALAGPRPARIIRNAYARTVKRRELRSLRDADALAVAGYADFASLPATPPADWIPTPPPANGVLEPTRPGDRLRLGFLGHFHHHHTLLGAEALIASPLAQGPVELVFGGLGSEVLTARRGVRVIGPVREPHDFYERVDAVIVPVLGGSGMKVKLAESVLAGRPTVTTPLGAEGFAPELRHNLLVREVHDFGSEEIRAHIDAWDRERALAEFREVLGWEAAVTSYGRAIGGR